MIPARVALLLSLALPVASCPAARAQTDGKGGGAATPTPAPAAPETPAPRDEIVVTAPRYGEASIAAETEFGEDEIAGQGADSIQGLLDRLAPFIDPSGEEPVLLINGRPADGDRAILSYPAEALNRLAILKPDAAARYGYPAGKRVVNLILKKHFTSTTLDAGGWSATRGGQYGGELSTGRVAIDGPTRWSATARITQDSALRKSARDIAPAPGIFDGTGIVTGLAGGEIDPALSLAAGRPIVRAAIPSGAEWQPPMLADFAAAADRTAPVDPNAFETLLPSKRTAMFNAGISHPLGAFSASLNLNASSTDSNALRGLPMASAVLPAGNPWSPFSGDVLLVRPLAGTRALRNDNSAQMLGAALSLTGRVSGWQLALSASYARNWSDSLLERGIDLPRVQALLDAGDPGLNPYGPWSRQLLLTNRNHSQGESISARLNAIGKMLDLPAGPVTANATINLNHNTLESRISTSSADALVMTRQSSRLDGQLSINLPISGRTKGALGPLGDLTIDLIAGGQAISGASLQKRYGAGFTWAPARFVQLRGTLENVDAAPTPDQLDAPVVTTINRIFDYARQEAVDAVWILGGNPGLRRGTRQNRSLTAMLRPLSDQTLTLNFGYAEQAAKGGVAPFPELTPAIEAAFPERIVRDTAGRLVSVDARPINLVGETSADFSSGVALRLPRRRTGPSAQAAADPINWTVSLNYRRRLKSELRTRPGLPVIDQLGDDSGQSRDRLSLQLTAGKRGIGASLNGSWSGAARLRNRASPGSDYRFSAWSTLNLSAFVEPEHLLAKTGHAWLKDIKLSLEIRNLFNGYRRVRLPDGSIPIGYSHDEIDPLSRTARLTLRKRF